MTAIWDAESVLAASNEWVWVPDGAQQVRTAEYLVVAYPDYFITPTSARVFGSDRDPAEIADEICAVAAGWDRTRLWWRLSDDTRPAGLEAELLARGATVLDRMDVLALPLDGSLPELDLPPGLEVARVRDEQGLRDHYVVNNDAFGGGEPTDEQISAGLAEVAEGNERGDSARFVAYVDGIPAGTGGFTIAGDVCRLWGGGTHNVARGRGAYRAVLDARLRAGAAAGATLALTHGVIETSSPILRRVGFARYGEERVLVLDLTTGS